MKVKGVSRIRKDSGGYFHIKFDKEADRGRGYYMDSDRHHRGQYWAYAPSNKTHTGLRWSRDWNKKASKYCGNILSTPFEFMLLTGVSLLSAIRRGKIDNNDRGHFLTIRRNIRKLNPTPRKKRVPKPKKMIWQLKKT